MPTPEEIPGETAEPTPLPEFEREDLKIQVLNGSGVPGRAGEAKAFLEDLGYENIEIGNADSYDYEETVIKVEEEATDLFDFLKSDLEEEYDLRAESDSLEENSDYDVVIILGEG